VGVLLCRDCEGWGGAGGLLEEVSMHVEHLKAKRFEAPCFCLPVRGKIKEAAVLLGCLAMGGCRAP
jgi:hypothetical protein